MSNVIYKKVVRQRGKGRNEGGESAESGPFVSL
jgi:hypothetical protein